MENKRENIIDKIRNLLNKSVENGASPAEATQAALLAQRLIAKYDVEDSELYETISYEVVEIRSEPVFRKFKYNLATVIAQNYRCRVYFETVPSGRKHVAVFMGRNIDANAATLVYNRLYDAVNDYANSESRQYRGRGYGLYGDFYNSAAIAFIDGVRSELEKQCHELMLVTPQDVNDKFEQKTAGYRRADNRLGNAGRVNYEKGFNAGRDAVRSGRIEQTKTRQIGA